MKTRPLRFARISGVALAVAAASPAAAAGRASTYTSIANGQCRFDRMGAETGAEESQTKRCRGLAGIEVIVDAGGTTTGLGFAWPARRPPVPAVHQVAVGWSLGEKIEWRGSGASPDAVIARLIFMDAEAGRKHQVLAVLHIGPRDACLVGAVDMTVDKAPYRTARRIADAGRSALACDKNLPIVEGGASAWTGLTLQRSLRHDQ